MNLKKKKFLAARTLNVGIERIIFNTERLGDIKEAITKQDIKDLFADKAIFIREIKGRRKKSKRKTRRRIGSIRNRAINKKRVYITITRKLRKYLLFLKRKKLLSQENFIQIRKEIRARAFHSLSQLKERLKEANAK